MKMLEIRRDFFRRGRRWGEVFRRVTIFRMENQRRKRMATVRAPRRRFFVQRRERQAQAGRMREARRVFSGKHERKV